MKTHLYFISVILLLTSIYCQDSSNSSNNTAGSNAIVTPPFNYALPDFTNTMTFFSDMSETINEYLYQSAWLDIFNYMGNNCTDSRVPNLFGVNQTDSPDDYQGLCIALTLDFFKYYDNYQCNNWICNFKGICSFVVNNDSSINQSCNCNSGYNGQNCVFTNQNYKYIKDIINGAVSWVNLKNSKNNGNLFGGNNTEYLGYLNMASSLLFLGISATTDSSLNPRFQSLISPFFNSGLNLTSDQQDTVQGYIDIILSEPKLMSLVNPLDLASITNSQKPDQNFGSYNQDIDPNQDSNLSFNGRRRILFEVVRKFLQTTSTSTNSNSTKSSASQPAKGINMDNPRCTIPKDITSKLPTGSKLSLSFVRDPKMYNLNTTALNGNLIVSQVLSIGAKNSGNSVTFPSGVTTTYSCQVPFSSVPLNCSSFQVNCNVVSFNNGVWKNETSCSVLSNTSPNTAQVSCNTFGTIAVNCNKNCKVDTTQVLSATKRVNTTNSNSTKSSGSYVYLSALISAVLAFILC